MARTLKWLLKLSLLPVAAVLLFAAIVVVGSEDQQEPPTVVGLAPGANVPAEYVPLLEEAAQTCAPVTAPLLAAQIAQESGWNPRAVSPVGAQGLSQFMPATWAAYGIDADGDGTADPFTPADAIASQAKYMCAI